MLKRQIKLKLRLMTEKISIHQRELNVICETNIVYQSMLFREKEKIHKIPLSLNNRNKKQVFQKR